MQARNVGATLHFKRDMSAGGNTLQADLAMTLPEGELSPAAILGAPPGSPPSELHADDSYCALCRRCQMRKKLERRLAAKKGLMSPYGGDELATVSPQARQDDRSLDELLDYIGEGSDRSKHAKKQRKKRTTAARKRNTASADWRKGHSGDAPSSLAQFAHDSSPASAHLREQGATSPDKVHGRREQAPSSAGSSPQFRPESPVSDDGDYEPDDPMHGKTSSAFHHREHSPNAREFGSLSNDSRISDEELHDELDIPEMSREEKLAIEASDREVEEFRRRLESVHLHRTTQCHGPLLTGFSR